MLKASVPVPVAQEAQNGVLFGEQKGFCGKGQVALWFSYEHPGAGTGQHAEKTGCAYALRLDRAVRDVIALVKHGPGATRDTKGFPPGYFEQTAGAFADIEIERAPQGELPPAVEW